MTEGRDQQGGDRGIGGRATEAPPRPDGTQQRPAERPPERQPWKVEGAPSPPGGGGPSKPDWRRVARRSWWLVLAALLVNWILASAVLSSNRLSVSYTFFREQVQADNVVEITSTGDTIEGTFRKAVKYPPGDANAKDVTRFTTVRPAFADDGLTQLLFQHHVDVNAKPPDSAPVWQQLLVGFGPTLLFLGLLVWFFRRSAAGGGLGGLGGIGRSRARRYEPESGPRTTFADVAGIDEVKAELMEVVDFLRNPDRYRRLGAAIPKGVLLSGPPGTGKTLLARAVAGEASVPFFHLSASEFIEMIVGVGASRVRDLFETAKKAAPAIIFIDELDAIGRARGGSSIGGVDEREQTLNQILTEMDGFTGTEGVVVLAATNRPDVLDPALLRPGRFDRRIIVSPPDQEGRRKILEVHTRHVPLAPDVDLAAIAATTPGMVGADLRNLVNEAALTAARRDRSAVTMADFLDALEKIVLGTPRKIMMTRQERQRTAYHESGHALLGMLTPGADPVRKVSIIPRGHALGVTFQSPDADQYAYAEPYLRGRIIGALGGRAAEEIVYGNVSTGSEADLDQVSRVARNMVGRWGMSPRIGPIAVLPAEGQAQPFLVDGTGPAPATKELVDTEARRISDECYAEAVRVLRDNRDRLERLAQELLEHETLDAEAAYAAAGVPRTARQDLPSGEEVPAGTA
ncbi:MAG TPA: ATP-dependent zinc metalloprotease FtsH [Mycobacteriales bacterium]|nr:ATP-dependent zinc metalloprotease FtsH [Mycobacteriales bacterium]